MRNTILFKMFVFAMGSTLGIMLPIYGNCQTGQVQCLRQDCDPGPSYVPCEPDEYQSQD